MDRVHEITIEELKELMDQGKKVSIIDVREEEEVIHGMIEGAIHIPLMNLPLSLSKLAKDEHYILVCRSGARSYDAALYLKGHSFKVSNLKGGMLKWEGELFF